MNIVLFGEDVFSATALQSFINHGFKISLVVSPVYKNNNHKNLQAIAEQNNIKFMREADVNSDAVKNCLLTIKPDVIVTVHLRKILSKEIFSIAKLGAINIHPSLLPKYRGLSPQHQALIHGDTESAVTVHFIEEGVDTGDIIVQEIIPISNDDYIHDFQLKMLSVYKTILVEAVNRIADKNFRPVKQNLESISYFGNAKAKDREIDFSKSKIAALNLIRAFSLPYKGAWSNKHVIWRAEMPIENKEKEYLKAFLENKIYKIDEDTIILRFTDGVLISDDFEIIDT